MHRLTAALVASIVTLGVAACSTSDSDDTAGVGDPLPAAAADQLGFVDQAEPPTTEPDDDPPASPNDELPEEPPEADVYELPLHLDPAGALACGRVEVALDALADGDHDAAAVLLSDAVADLARSESVDVVDVDAASADPDLLGRAEQLMTVCVGFGYSR